MPKKQDYSFLLKNYSKVELYLTNENSDEDIFSEIIVSFCIVVERVLKKKLHSKNPFLIFDASVIKEGLMIPIALKKEESLRTSGITNILERFILVFKDTFSEDEEQVLKKIFKIRNQLLHGHRADNHIDYNEEDLAKRMGTVWEKISEIARKMFTKSDIKRSRPLKKYSEEELNQVLENELKELIKPKRKETFGFIEIENPFEFEQDLGFGNLGTGLGSKSCPRCKRFSFRRDSNAYTIGVEGTDLELFTHTEPTLSYVGNPNLYKCDSCGLELTEKQYALVKKMNE